MIQLITYWLHFYYVLTPLLKSRVVLCGRKELFQSQITKKWVHTLPQEVLLTSRFLECQCWQGPKAPWFWFPSFGARTGPHREIRLRLFPVFPWPARGPVRISVWMPPHNCAARRPHGIFHFPHAPILPKMPHHRHSSSLARPSFTEAQSTFPFWKPDPACWPGWAADSSTSPDSLCARVNSTLSQSLSEPWDHLIPQSFSFLPPLASTQNARSNSPLSSHILVPTLLFVPLLWVIFPSSFHFPVKLLAFAHMAPSTSPAFSLHSPCGEYPFIFQDSSQSLSPALQRRIFTCFLLAALPHRIDKSFHCCLIEEKPEERNSMGQGSYHSSLNGERICLHVCLYWITVSLRA